MLSKKEQKPRLKYLDYKIATGRFRDTRLTVKARKEGLKREPMTNAERELFNQLTYLAEELNKLRKEFTVLKDRLTRKGVI